MKKLKIGLVGLPNVGKSSLFGLISGKQVLVANYPFSTTNTNAALVNFQDERVVQLGNFFKSEKMSFDTYELIDIARIARKDSQRTMLGDEFLSSVRSVDLLCHVVRCFRNDDVIHVEESIDPVRDINTARLEFISADLQQIERRLEKLSKALEKEENKQFLEEKIVLEKISNRMNEEVAVKEMELTKQEEMIIKPYNLLTNKPSIVVANYNFDSPNGIKELQKDCENIKVIAVDAALETEYKDFSFREREELGYSPFSPQEFSKEVISKLQLKSFFTAGKSEARNWISHLETNAAECAGLIHSEIRNRLVRVEVYQVKNLDNWKICSRKELVSYLIKDGDVCNFLFS